MAFLRKHSPFTRPWSIRALADWFFFHWHNGSILCVRDGSRIVAAAVARQVDFPREALEDDYLNLENGRIVWIDMIASVRPRGLRLLALLLVQNVRGTPLAVCGRVVAHNFRPRVIPWPVFLSKIINSQPQKKE